MSRVEAVEIIMKSLSEKEQEELLRYADYLVSKGDTLTPREEDKEWNSFSLTNAMRDSDDEPDLYSLEDIKERWN